jgi:hypothetical protein
MNVAIDDTAIYHSGRTYAEHCAWLDSLTGNDWRIVQMPIGHLQSLAVISYFKHVLLNLPMTAAERMKFLDGIGSCIYGCITAEAVEVIEPACDTAVQMMHELQKVDRRERTQAFSRGGMFRLLAQLNPSLLRALELCDLGSVPEIPRNRAPERCQLGPVPQRKEA